MAKILIIHDGDPQIVAAIPTVRKGIESVPGMEARVLSIAEADTPDVKAADGIAIGCPTRLGGISWPMKEWWDARTPDIWLQSDGRFAVPFTAAGPLGSGGELACMALSITMMNMGYFVFGVPDASAKLPHYGGIVGAGGYELERIGARLAQWCAGYMDGREDALPSSAPRRREGACRVLILYDSDSDRQFTSTAVPLVRQGVESVSGMETRARKVTEATPEDVAWADGIAIGCPTHLGGVSWRMKQWWQTQEAQLRPLTEGKFATPFTSAGSIGGGGELACMALSMMMMNMGATVYGVTDYIGKKESLHYGAVFAGEPRAEHAKAACKRAGRRLAEWLGYFLHERKELHPLAVPYQRFWGLEGDEGSPEADKARLLVELQVKPDEADAFVSMFHSQFIARSRAEDGCERYELWRDVSDANGAGGGAVAMTIVEVWRDKHALDAHLAQDWFAEWAPKMEAALDKPLVVRTMVSAER